MMPVIRTKVRQLLLEKQAKDGVRIKMREFAEQVDIPQKTLRLYMNDTIANINRGTLEKLMAYFELKSFDEFFVRVGDEE